MASRRRPVTKLDADLCDFLLEGATLVGEPGIPMLSDMGNVRVPTSMVPYERMGTELRHGHTAQCVCGYSYDRRLRSMLTSVERRLPEYQLFESVATPDLSIIDGQPRCLQEANVCLSRAFGSYLQRHGVPVIPTVRWGDESTYDFCFLGIPTRSIVTIGTLTCTATPRDMAGFRAGLEAMLEVLDPAHVVVYGSMPTEIFWGVGHPGCEFHHVPSRASRVPKKRPRGEGQAPLFG